MKGYTPSWSKYSEGGKKAAATRNYKKHVQNMELFLREVLPVILPLIDSDSKHEIGVCFMLPDLLAAGNRSLWQKGDKSSWIMNGDAAEAKALEIGAEKLTIEKAIAFMAEQHK